jgi:hypothetical protein
MREFAQFALRPRLALDSFPRRRLKRAHVRDHHFVEDVLFRLEVMIDQRLGGLAASGEAGHRGAVETLAREQRRRGEYNRLPPLVVIRRLRPRHLGPSHCHAPVDPRIGLRSRRHTGGAGLNSKSNR